MKMNLNNRFKRENGAVSTLVLITVLTFVALLSGAFITVTTMRETQLKSDKRIQEIYGQDVSMINEIYEEAISSYEESEDSLFRVGNKVCTSLEDIISELENIDESVTVNLTNDLNITDLADSESPINVMVFPDNSTLDLQGHTIRQNKFGLVFIGNGLTVKNGTFISDDASYSLWFWDEDEIGTDNVTIENVYVKGGINVYNAHKVTIKNTTVEGHRYYAVYGNEECDITIESGNYSTDGYNGLLGMVNTNAEGSFKIKGGSFNMTDKKLLTNSSLAPVITGGTFNASINVSYIPSGYEQVIVDGNYVVREIE